MRILKASAARTIMVLVTDASDHVTGKAGATLAITASKAGGAFAAITPAVTERGSGWYALDLTATHTDTEGDLVLHITAAGADPTDVACQVLVDTIATAVRAEMDTNSTKLAAINTDTQNIQSRLPAALVGGRMDSNVGAMAADVLTAAAVAADAVAEIQGGLADAATLNAVGALVTEMRKLLRNKRILDPATGVETLYDDNGSVLFTRNVFEDAAGTQPYRDSGADRVERYA